MPPRRTSSPKGRLKEYRAKRNFSRTPEPSGAAPAAKPKRARRAATRGRKRASMFCVQKHLATQLHYDLRLEHAGVLLSWAVPKGPSVNPADKRLAMKVEDHPIDYGDFEGVIPEGYGAGIVLLWDKGSWKPVPPETDIDAALKKGELKFELEGVKLKGGYVLVRTRGPESRSWLLIKHRDHWTADIDITEVAAMSVKSFGDFEDILAQEKPDVWMSNRLSARGGAAGAMLKKIIERAAKLRTRKKPQGAQKTQSSR